MVKAGELAPCHYLMSRTTMGSTSPEEGHNIYVLSKFALLSGAFIYLGGQAC